MKYPTIWHVRPAKAQISLLIHESLCKSLEYSVSIKLQIEHHMEFFKFKMRLHRLV